MKRSTQKFIALLLIAIGIPVSILSISVIIDRDARPIDRREATAAMMFFGLVPTAGGSFWWWTLQRQRWKAEQNRLRSIFFHLLQEGQGRMSILNFSLVAQIPAAAAETYLNHRLREFQGTFEVEDGGNILYCFDIGSGLLELPGESPDRYSVMILELPERGKRNVVRSAQKLTQLPWSEIKATLRQPLPIVLQSNLSKQVAQDSSDRLTEAGATVAIVLESKDER